MSETSRQRILIVVFDALRPEFVTPELMPNLHNFASEGVHYVNARSTFPTETRVNQSAVITGCYPHKHGIVANKFVLDEGGQSCVLNTGDDHQLEAAFTQLQGRLLDVPTLGERLSQAGRSYATISAGTPIANGTSTATPSSHRVSRADGSNAAGASAHSTYQGQSFPSALNNAAHVAASTSVRNRWGSGSRQ